MKQNIMGLFFTLTIIAALCSCKKETALPAETPVTQLVKEKLQDWYTAQTAKGQPDGDKIKFFLNAGTPEWENAVLHPLLLAVIKVGCINFWLPVQP
jgi:hypothetical protein